MKTELEKFIDTNREDLDTRMPDPAILSRILKQMEAKPEIQQPKGVVIPFRVLQWAAAAFVLLACVIAVYTLRPKTDNPVVVAVPQTPKTITRVKTEDTQTVSPKQAAVTLPQTKNTDAVDAEIAKQKSALMAKFNNTNASRKLVMLTSLQDMDSPARRITAVTQANDFKLAGQDIITALLRTLNKDPNTNVRLAALDGLARFYRETYIRKQLIASLKTQQNPTVQIALIELLTRMKEAAVLTELDKIVASDSTMNAVKDCAYSGIFKLRRS